MPPMDKLVVYATVSFNFSFFHFRVKIRSNNRLTVHKLCLTLQTVLCYNYFTTIHFYNSQLIHVVVKSSDKASRSSRFSKMSS